VLPFPWIPAKICFLCVTFVAVEMFAFVETAWDFDHIFTSKPFLHLNSAFVYSKYQPEFLFMHLPK